MARVYEQEHETSEILQRGASGMRSQRSVLITGEVDRTSEFETGFQGHEALRGGGWRPDPLILDDQALVVRLGELGASLLVPAHCTGWKAVHQLAARFPDAFLQCAVGTTIEL